MMPSDSGVVEVVDAWARAKVAAAVIRSNNSPVFFMLSPTLNAPGLPRLSLRTDKGYSRKVTSAGARVKVTRVFSPLETRAFPLLCQSFLLHMRWHPCNIAPLLQTNGLGFVVHLRAP